MGYSEKTVCDPYGADTSVPGRYMGLWNMETRSDTIGVAIGKRERHANVGSVAGQNVKHVGGRIHPNVLADMAEGRAMGFVCPDGFHAGVGIGAFKI